MQNYFVFLRCRAVGNAAWRERSGISGEKETAGCQRLIAQLPADLQKCSGELRRLSAQNSWTNTRHSLFTCSLMNYSSYSAAVYMVKGQSFEHISQSRCRAIFFWTRRCLRILLVRRRRRQNCYMAGRSCCRRTAPQWARSLSGKQDQMSEARKTHRRTLRPEGGFWEYTRLWQRRWSEHEWAKGPWQK